MALYEERGGDGMSAALAAKRLNRRLVVDLWTRGACDVDEFELLDRVAHADCRYRWSAAGLLLGDVLLSIQGMSDDELETFIRGAHERIDAARYGEPMAPTPPPTNLLQFRRSEAGA
jgi:hypothetical protein